MNNKLSTNPYKGVRDFYPEDMAAAAFQSVATGIFSATPSGPIAP